MDLVIDASIVFTAISGKGVTKEIIFLDALKLHAPEHLADEIGANSIISDKDDTEYLALSLSMNGVPIWSNDDHFKKQNSVEVFTTSELVSELKAKGILS